MVEEGAGGASLLIAHDGESSRRGGAYTVWKGEGVGALTAETSASLWKQQSNPN